MDNIFDEARKKGFEVKGKALVEALKKLGYKACYANDKESALSEVLKIIPEKSSVGVPGTVTIREIGAMDKLAERGCTVIHHWDPNFTPEQRKDACMDEYCCDYILTSTNAVTCDGTMVNIDGNGNRVSAMAWGKNVLIFVVGVNKIAANLDEAITMARAATIPNAIRLHIEPPCVKIGRCVNCDSASRVCKAMLILERPTTGRETHVIVVGEPLGY